MKPPFETGLEGAIWLSLPTKCLFLREFITRYFLAASGSRTPYHESGKEPGRDDDTYERNADGNHHRCNRFARAEFLKLPDPEHVRLDRPEYEDCAEEWDPAGQEPGHACREDRVHGLYDPFCARQ